MQFRQLAPPDDLSGFVRYFWTLESFGNVPVAFNTLADGCPGLVLQLTPESLLRDRVGKPWPSSFLYGQTTHAGTIAASSPFRAIGVCFEPSALAAGFRLDAAELTDGCLDLSLLEAPQARYLAEQLAAQPSLPAQVDCLAAFLRGCAARQPARVDARIERLVTQLTGSGGRVSLAAAPRALGLSERSLQRKFKHSVGISPQLFARICRFQASLAQLRTRQYEKFSDLAFALDYADQSHHIRTFREFAGASPQQMRQQARPGIPEFPELLR